ncbi:MAG: hypothetical protein Q7J45_01290 [bacterium]|nr:hypothetical protein [bacterium]
MNLYRSVFSGQWNRKQYIIALVVLLFVGGVAAQVGKEIGPGAFVLVWSAVYLLTSILDAKRLRDLEVPGKVALAVALIYIAVWAPYTYDVLVGARLPYPTSSTLTFVQFCYLGGHLYLLFAKGSKKTAQLV